MKAIVCTGYGTPDVLKFMEIERPIPKPDELLIKVRATTVTTADTMMRRGIPFYGRIFIGLRRPKHPVPGTGFAGDVEAVGREVKNFKAGDTVFGETGVKFGANAEFVCVPENGVLAKKPANVSYEQAAPVCDGALTALNFLKNLAGIHNGNGSRPRGKSILINGASGGIGSAAVQLAEHFGTEVTGVSSSANLEMVRTLGAEKVIDYTREDFTASGTTYDVVFDTIGKTSFRACGNALKPGGLYLSPVLGLPLLLQMLWTSRIGKQGKQAKFSATGLRPVSELRGLLTELTGLLQAGKIKSVIDRRYPLEEIPDAHRYVEGGHKKGNVVILPSHTGAN